MASAIVMTMNGTVQPPSGYEAYASLQYGSNGDTWGSPEMSIGTQNGDVADGRYTWDPSDSGAFDSGSTLFSLEVTKNSSGGEHIVLSLAGSSISADLPFSSVGQIEIDAGAQTNGEVSTSGVGVEFLNGTANSQGLDLGSTATIDDTTSSNPCDETVASVTDGSSTDNGVDVTGAIRLTAPDGTYPGASDLFLAMYVFA